MSTEKPTEHWEMELSSDEQAYHREMATIHPKAAEGYRMASPDMKRKMEEQIDKIAKMSFDRQVEAKEKLSKELGGTGDKDSLEAILGMWGVKSEDRE